MNKLEKNIAYLFQKIGKTTVHRSLQNKRAAMQALTNDKTKVLEGEQSRNEQ